MLFHVYLTERETHDPQEEVAMLRHRIESLNYWMGLLRSKRVGLVFKTAAGSSTVLIVDSESVESLDRLIKAEPLFPYATVTVEPVISSRSMVEELQDYLGEKLLNDKELSGLEQKPVTIDPHATYFMIIKTLKAFSPLLSKEQQRDIHRRTALSQRLHTAAIEVADCNPVGRPVGILFAKCKSLDEIQQHVAKAPIYPDTIVEFHQLLTLEQALSASTKRLGQLTGHSEGSMSAGT